MGIAGPALTGAEAALLAAHPPAGVILFGRNVQTPEQLRALTASLRAVLPVNAVIAVDQEGGRVARLRPPHWPAHPAAGALGALDPARGRRAAYLTGALIGALCAAEGFDLVCAPVLDLRIAGASDVIGDRSFGTDPAAVAALAMAMADGLLAAGVLPVGKHAPGHGQALVDSHLALPTAPAAADLGPDIAVFAACRGLPWMMTAHLLYEGLDATLPGTLSPLVIERVIRGRIGFEGVLVSDDLAMRALAGAGAGPLATAAVAAGCDVALHCTGALAESEAVLRAVPPLAGRARARWAAARELARVRRTTLDPAAMTAERDRLLAC